VGRKSYLFMGSEGGGKAGAIAYTLSVPVMVSAFQVGSGSRSP
jgi:hypothetical protein